MMSRLGAPAVSGPLSDSFLGRKKVVLAPGHSLMDWIRLGRNQGDLSGVGANKRPVTPGELANHNTSGDIWMSIRGKVYNITPYMDYHPGGTDELMRAAGKDGTEIFDEIHNWVNVESMMDKCLVGPIQAGKDFTKRSTKLLAPPPAPLAKPLSAGSGDGILPDRRNTPTDDWYQTSDTVTLVIYSKFPNLKHDDCIVDYTRSDLLVQIVMGDMCFFLHIDPFKPLDKKNIRVDVKGGKANIIMVKEKKGENWPSLGKTLKMNGEYKRLKHVESPNFKDWTVISNTYVTHDTRLLTFRPPVGLRMVVPVAKHIVICKNVSGMDIARNYTVARHSFKPTDADLTEARHSFNVSESESVRPEEPHMVHLMIKLYEGGAITPWICAIKEGQQAKMSATYFGTFHVEAMKGIGSLVMFGGGTGFTSMIGIIQYVLFFMPGSTFPVTLLLYNKMQKDIPWKAELDALSKAHKRFTIHHILSREPETSRWQGMKGRVSSSHYDMYCPKPGKQTRPMVLVSGPYAFNDMAENLAKIHGLLDSDIHVFSQNS